VEIRRRQPVATIAMAVGAVVVLAMAVVLLLSQERATDQSRLALATGRVAAHYRDARFALAQQESAERAYMLEREPAHRAEEDAAAGRVVSALRLVPSRDAAALLRDHAAYVDAERQLFAAAAAGRTRRMHEADDDLADPAFDAIERELTRRVKHQSALAVTLGARAHQTQVDILRTGGLEILLALVIFVALGRTVRRSRRSLDAARAAELERLAELATTDALTGLRNHRAFHEDLARELQRTGRQAVPLSLVVLDLDDLKTLNDDHGHQAGDERLQTLAETIRDTTRGADCAYRIGGDEFAVILPDCRAWGALEYVQRLQLALPGFGATAGVAEALTLRSRDELFREADLALLAAKRLGQAHAIFTPEMHAVGPVDTDEHHTRMLATALARAVDAKDSYTRSHCQTVSQLTALVGAELGLPEERIARLRLAGLLHDVGKIGVPDAILNKPAKLTDEEYEQMQRHALLGFEIVDAAGLPEEARWVRHHHERVDGRGYPDRLSGEDIPLESRIILVADAFEAMTSDRPYRKAPGQDFAVAELRRGAGTQFDAGVVDALCRALTAEREPATA
jgi:diguanylate cyclase (GGDEF)-like protein/putative nucleotidyltransferase with HDIG domain